MRAILTYHSIDDSGSVISIAPSVFREHVRWLSAGGPRVLPLADLLARESEDEADAVAMTFDDGFLNFREAAAVLMENSLPVTLFVVTGHVGGTNNWGGRAERGIPTLPLLDWPELEALARSGVGIGAHTHSHARLTALPPAAVDEELNRCAEVLRQRLGVTARYFSYPYGAVDDRVAAAAATRFAGAVTTEFRLLDRTALPTRLPRLDMFYFRQSGALEGWGGPGFRRTVKWTNWKRRVREVFV